jgi:hypothetical protein
MPQDNKMICLDCGAEMNHHAMKFDYGNDDPAIVDPVFGGVLKEAHTCPNAAEPNGELPKHSSRTKWLTTLKQNEL